MGRVCAGRIAREIRRDECETFAPEHRGEDPMAIGSAIAERVHLAARAEPLRANVVAAHIGCRRVE
jgi:hypothetical protein